MDKIRLKIFPSSDIRSFSALTETLKRSRRKYEHMTLNGTQVDERRCLQFIESHKHLIKSLKLSTCHFRSVPSKIAFLEIIAPTIEELEFENVIIDSIGHYGNYRDDNQQRPFTVNFLKLRKLKCGTLPGEFICTTLKTLELYATNQNRALTMLKLNPGLEELTITYEVLDSIFRRDWVQQGISLKLKKLQILKHHGSDPMDSTSNRNFQTFLMTQTESLEEVVIDWFSGKPKERRQNNDWFDEPDFRRRRRDDREGAFLDVRRVHRHRIADNIADAAEDICVKALQTIFREFKRIRKVIVADKQGFLSESICPTVGVLNIVPNPNITELRLRFEKAPLSNLLLEKLVSACPNVKSLFVHEMDQRSLECTSREMIHLESLFALSFKVDTLPCDLVKFEKLQKLNFCECVITNHPELTKKKTAEQKPIILQMMK
jgi:hypothetical protein